MTHCMFSNWISPSINVTCFSQVVSVSLTSLMLFTPRGVSHIIFHISVVQHV